MLFVNVFCKRKDTLGEFQVAPKTKSLLVQEACFTLKQAKKPKKIAQLKAPKASPILFVKFMASAAQRRREIDNNM